MEDTATPAVYQGPAAVRTENPLGRNMLAIRGAGATGGETRRHAGVAQGGTLPHTCPVAAASAIFSNVWSARGEARPAKGPGMNTTRRACLGAVSTLLLLAGCASNPPGTGGQVDARSERLTEIFISGFSIAPVGHADPVVNAGEIAAFMSNNLYTALLVSFDGTPLIGPEHFLNQVNLYEEQGLDDFRRFRRRRVLNEPLEKDECTRMSQMVLHRYVLLTWVEESESQILEDYGQDYVDSTHANDVRRIALTVLNGELHGRLIDLWDLETLWSGHAKYQSQKVFLQSMGAQEELERARLDGILNFVHLLQSQ